MLQKFSVTNRNKIFISGSIFLLLGGYFVLTSSVSKLDNNEENVVNNTSIFLSTDAISTRSTILLSTSQNCLLTTFKTWKNSSFWVDIPNTVNNCNQRIISSVPFLETTTLHPEHKLYMLPRLKYINDVCSVVTFGIGGDIHAEQHIQMTLPQCTFLGFDPNSKFRNIFVDVLGGTFVQAAVSGKTGVNTVYKLENGNYTNVSNSKMTSASTLIELYHGRDKLIDILNIDVEGFEFSIMDRLIHDAVYKNVCQINFEFHPVWFHETGYSYLDVVKVFEDVIKEGTFIWFKSLDHKPLFPSYFINVKNELCVEKYLKGRLL